MAQADFGGVLFINFFKFAQCIYLHNMHPSSTIMPVFTLIPISFPEALVHIYSKSCYIHLFSFECYLFMPYS